MQLSHTQTRESYSGNQTAEHFAIVLTLGQNSVVISKDTEGGVADAAAARTIKNKALYAWNISDDVAI